MSRRVNPNGWRKCAHLSSIGSCSPDGRTCNCLHAARAAGVTHIIEEGRYGATIALKQLAPQVRLLDGDGGVLLPQLFGLMDAEESARTLVIFDGEKRFGAWKTFQKIKDKVAVAVFDDTNLEAREFRRMLDRTNQVWWQVSDPWFRDFLCSEEVPLHLIARLLSYRGRWMGGVNHLEVFDFAIVRGGAWAGNAEYQLDA